MVKISQEAKSIFGQRVETKGALLIMNQDWNDWLKEKKMRGLSVWKYVRRYFVSIREKWSLWIHLQNMYA